jgi:hypothetical protein
MPDPKKKDPNDPSTTALWYDEMAPVWMKVESVLGGTPTMREARQAYLPRHEEESEKAYEERLFRNVLYNQTELTLNSMVGRPFSDPVRAEDVPDQVSPWLDDVDLQGNNIDVFARHWFRDGVAKSFSHVLIDAPRPREPEDAEGRPRERTLADDQAENLRPYWVHIPPERLIDAHAEMVDGREVLTHIRFEEDALVREGFSTKVVKRIRGVEPGEMIVWELVKTRRRKEEWVEVDRYPFALPFVPLVTFYADRKAFMFGKPPIADLCDLNIAHWQSMSDQIAVLTVSRFPILAGSGISGKGDIPVGPNISLTTDDPQGKFYYVEHSGKAIAAGRQDLLDLEERMAEYGAQFLKRRPGNLTATARALDSAEATSPLQDMSMRFEDALNNALAISAAWARMDPAAVGALGVSTEFGPETADSADLTAIAAARKDRDISRVRRLHELKRRGVLDDSFDEDANLRELEEERGEVMGEAKTDIDPGQGDEDEDEEEEAKDEE